MNNTIAAGSINGRKKEKIPQCLNSSKIKQTRERGKTNISNTQIHDY